MTGQEPRGFVQTDLHGERMPEKDSKAFGRNYPNKPFDNSSIITFQNIGRLPKSAFGHKSIQMSKAFKDSKASIALYAEPSINDDIMIMKYNETYIISNNIQHYKIENEPGIARLLLHLLLHDFV